MSPAIWAKLLERGHARFFWLRCAPRVSGSRPRRAHPSPPPPPTSPPWPKLRLRRRRRRGPKPRAVPSLLEKRRRRPSCCRWPRPSSTRSARPRWSCRSRSSTTTSASSDARTSRPSRPPPSGVCSGVCRGSDLRLLRARSRPSSARAIRRSTARAIRSPGHLPRLYRRVACSPTADWVRASRERTGERQAPLTYITERESMSCSLVNNTHHSRSRSTSRDSRSRLFAAVQPVPESSGRDP